MNKVINLPRIAVRNWSLPEINSIWISISEPNDLNSVVSNPILDKLPKLNISFWDLTSPVEHNGDMLFPPSEIVAKHLVDFILFHRDKNVLVNCAAGVSRSGAVAQFCHDFLKYDWIEAGRRNAHPNFVLYNLMRDYFLSLDDEEKYGPRPLQSSYEKVFDKVE